MPGDPNTQTISLAIKASPAQIWHALVDGDTTPAYFVGGPPGRDPRQLGGPSRAPAPQRRRPEDR
jgi:uncharacterized protein YndB with AHSA1/START domain